MEGQVSGTHLVPKDCFQQFSHSAVLHAHWSVTSARTPCPKRTCHERTPAEPCALLPGEPLRSPSFSASAHLQIKAHLSPLQPGCSWCSLDYTLCTAMQSGSHSLLAPGPRSRAAWPGHTFPTPQGALGQKPIPRDTCSTCPGPRCLLQTRALRILLQLCYMWVGTAGRAPRLISRPSLAPRLMDRWCHLPRSFWCPDPTGATCLASLPWSTTG